MDNPWIFEEAGRSSSYATVPLRWRTMKGPKCRGDNFWDPCCCTEICRYAFRRSITMFPASKLICLQRILWCSPRVSTGVYHKAPRRVSCRWQNGERVVPCNWISSFQNYRGKEYLDLRLLMREFHGDCRFLLRIW